MTSLAISLSADSRGPAAIYIITDSRITWGNDTLRWEAGRKVFASKSTADIFGYCGYAFFPSMLLGQVVEALDADADQNALPKSTERNDKVFNLLKASTSKVTNVDIGSFSIFHASRDYTSLKSQFSAWSISYDSKLQTWDRRKIEFQENRSYLVHIDGTGSKSILQMQAQLKASGTSETARSAIWSFCDALHNGTDKFSGGAPQIVGIFRKDAGQNFGFFWHGKKYLLGLPISDDYDLSKIQWFNHLFERCDGKTGKRLKEAKKQPRP